MESVTSINYSRPAGFQPLSRRALQYTDVQIIHQPAAPPPDLAALAGQLPAGPAQDITGAFRRIHASANQAAEPGQPFENLELLQEKVSEEISALKSLFERLSQDDLKLFAAIFQHQIPDIIPAPDQDRDHFLTPQPLDDLTPELLENLLQIDVTSLSGSLAALDLSGIIIDALLEKSFGSRLLESLLEDLTDSIFTFRTTEHPDRDFRESGKTGNSAPATASLDHEIARLHAFPPSFAQVGSNPPTIIEIAG